MSKRQSSIIEGEEGCSSTKKQSTGVSNDQSPLQAIIIDKPLIKKSLEFLRLEELKKIKLELSQALSMVVEKADENAELADRILEIAEELVKERVEKEKAQKAISTFEEQIIAAKKDLENEKKASDESKIRADELQERLLELNNIIRCEKDTKEQAEKKLSESENSLKLKDDSILALQKKNQKLNDEKTAANEKAKSLEAEVDDLKDENAKLKRKGDDRRREMNELETKYKKKKDLIDEIDAENRNLKKKLGEARDERRKMEKESYENNKFKLNNTLKDESLNKSSISSADNTPKWIVPEKLCENILNSNPRLPSFLQNYIAELFTSTENFLPEDKLNNEKVEEIKNVLFYFFNSNIKEMREMFYEKFKSIMNAKRSRARNSQYKHCTPTQSIGITSDGKKFYYSLKMDYYHWNNNMRWKPFTDKECQNILKYEKISSLSTFEVPNEYSSLEYIIIIENSGDGQKVHKMTPSTGYVNTVFQSKSKNEK